MKGDNRVKPITWIHTADLHLDMPIQGWKGSKEEIWKRQEEHRETFSRIISLVKEKKATFLWITGDFLEHGFVTHSTLEFVQAELKRIPDTHVWITPGNHDPYRQDSSYQLLRWPDHVYIFRGEWEEHVFKEWDLVIYGKGFRDFIEPTSSLPEVKSTIPRKIMLTHGTYLTHHEDSPYFPLHVKELTRLNLDYIALGHIHKPSTYTLPNERKTIVRYPGSPEGLNWKEQGVRTVTWGKIDEQGLQLEEIPIQTGRYEENFMDISDCKMKEDLLQKVLSFSLTGEKTSCYLLIHLTGQMCEELQQEQEFILPWLKGQLKREGWVHVYFENETVPELDLDYYRHHTGLIGAFIKRMETKIEQADSILQGYLRRAMFKTVELLLREKVKE
jgi:DNA repair exonuclease SbcCD nuclease subunit